MPVTFPEIPLGMSVPVNRKGVFVMSKYSLVFTVLFEDPFWVGYAELSSENEYAAAKHVFGSEPSNPEVWQYILKQYDKLFFTRNFSHNDGKASTKRKNPKRMQRENSQKAREVKVSTKAQEAIKISFTEIKVEKKLENRKNREEINRIKYSLRQMKKKEKNKGH